MATRFTLPSCHWLEKFPRLWFGLLFFGPFLAQFLFISLASNCRGLSSKINGWKPHLRKELVYGEDEAARADDFTVRGLFEELKGNYYRLYKNYIILILVEMSMSMPTPFTRWFLLFPSIVAGTMTLGLFQQINNAFDQVRGSFQVLFNDWDDIIKLISIYKRLRIFEATIGGRTPLDRIFPNQHEK